MTAKSKWKIKIHSEDKIC